MTDSVEEIARLRDLLAKYPEEWVIEKEPHNYNDGTKEFTHVRYRRKSRDGEEMCISIGEYVTPDLAELLILLRRAAIAALFPARDEVLEEAAAWHDQQSAEWDSREDGARLVAFHRFSAQRIRALKVQPA